MITPSIVNSNISFPFNQMQKASPETGPDGTHRSNRIREGQRQYTLPVSEITSRQHNQRHNFHQQPKQQCNEIQKIPDSSSPLKCLQDVYEDNETNNTHILPSSSNGIKKEEYTRLWREVGKYGMAQVEATRGDEGETSELQANLRTYVKWDQILNPLLQAQNKQQGMNLVRGKSVSETHLDAQQQQGQQKCQTSNTTAGGSYVFRETSSSGSVECDCGEDSCPSCNLLLRMSRTDV